MNRFFLISAVFILFSSFAGAQIIVTHKPVRPKVVVKKSVKPGKNYFWKIGYWHVRNGKYVWVDGHWAKAKQGQKWIAGHWRKVPKGWKWIPGHWQINR